MSKDTTTIDGGILSPLDIPLPDGTYNGYLTYFQTIIRLYSEHKIDHKELNSLAYAGDKMANVLRVNFQMEERIANLEHVAGIKIKTLGTEQEPAEQAAIVPYKQQQSINS